MTVQGSPGPQTSASTPTSRVPQPNALYNGPQTSFPQGPALATFEVKASVTLDGLVFDGAREKVAESIQRYADDLCSKMRDLERDQRELAADKAEYTASLVIKADGRLRRSMGAAPRTRADVTFALMAPLSSGAAGILGGYLHSVWQAVVFGAVASAAAICTVAVALKARSN